MKLALVIVAAGSGTRMKLGINKIFNTLNCNADEWVCCDGSTHFLKNTKIRSIFEITLLNFLKIKKKAKEDISQIIITYRFEDYDEMKHLVEEFVYENQELLGNTKIELVQGGQMRVLSVHNALVRLHPQITHVLVHDGVRPFVSFDLYERLMQELRKFSVCIPGMKLTDTVRAIDEGMLGAALDREKLCAVQTPQCYDIKIARGIAGYIEELKKNDEEDFISRLSDITDDSSLIARVFPEVEQRMIEGSKFNIKITTPDDMEFAKMFYRHLGGFDESRIGI